jgi:deferrochelatase/peroxidase EfeB
MSAEVLHRSAEHHAADAAEAVDANLDGHAFSPEKGNSRGLLGFKNGLAHGVGHVLGGEAEVLEQHRRRGRLAVACRCPPRRRSRTSTSRR